MQLSNTADLRRGGGWLGSPIGRTGFLVVLFGALALLLAQPLPYLIETWMTPEYSHGFIVLALSLWVIWQRRHMAWADREPGVWLGVALVVLGMAIYIAGIASAMQRLPIAGFLIVLSGVGLALLGPRGMRHFWMALLLLALSLPIPQTLYLALSIKLQLLSSEIAAWFLTTVGVSVFLDGNIIDLGAMQLQVAEACSGLRYLFPMLAFGFICAWLYRDAPVWARVFVLFSTIPITILTNSFRIALTGIFVDMDYMELADGFMHLFEGWVIFILAISCLIASMLILSRLLGRRHTLTTVFDFERIEATGAPQVGGRAFALSNPLIASLGVIALASATLIPLTQRPQIVPDRPSFASFPLAVEGWVGMPRLLDPLIERRLATDDYLLIDYQGPGGAPPVNLWVAYYGRQVGDAVIHSPKDCLPGAGWEYASLETVEAPVLGRDGKPFELNRGLIVKGDQRMLMYYWLDMRGRKITSDFLLRLWNLADSLTMQRSDGALVRLIAPLQPGEPVAAAEARLDALMAETYPWLEPYIGK